ncbi:MAG TPA: hypothetical protein VFO39_00485 [Candidatus Sulfotelmatobacter sp.]|nr:hypothetical protein [Candidatus Sulfotelmatobacter sp.]
MPAFELTKWYADCISDQGDAAIIYHAELRWRAVKLSYASLLTRRAGCTARARYSLRRHPAPALHAGQIAWECPDWRAVGSWRDLSPPHENVLFESDSGLLAWNCLAPRAASAVRIDPDPAIEGWGYVEHLRLSVAPWQLPIRRLRWGRFVNATDALVWIDWSGSYNTRVVYLNGSSVCATEIGDSELVLAENAAVLSLDRGTILRDGLLGSTALSVIPHLNRLFPDSILNMRECKWLSRAMLRQPGHPDSIGMAIHEVVDWP